MHIDEAVENGVLGLNRDDMAGRLSRWTHGAGVAGADAEDSSRDWRVGFALLAPRRSIVPLIYNPPG